MSTTSGRAAQPDASRSARSGDRVLARQRTVPVAISVARARSRSSVRASRTLATAGREIRPPGRDAPQDVVSGDARRRDHGRAEKTEPGASRSPGQELPRAARAAPFGLQFGDEERSAPGRDAQFVAVRDERWSPAPRATASADQVDRQRISRCPSRYEYGMRPGMEAANLVVDDVGRPGPVHHAVFLREPMSVGGQAVVLRRLRRPGRAARRSSVCTSRAAPSVARSRSTSSLVSFGPIGRSTVASIAPASSAFTTRMIVTPVVVSPAITARCTGAAPRYFGSSEACTLIMPGPRRSPALPA